VLNENEVELLCKGLSFCPTPKPHLMGLDNDLYDFTRRLRLKYHFRNSIEEDHSIVSLPSNFTPAPFANAELEAAISNVRHINVKTKTRYKDNIAKLRPALRSLIDKTERGEIVIKPADKGDVTVIMSPQFYIDMCMKELNKPEFYKSVGPNDPSLNIKNVVTNFANNFKRVLTPKEYHFLTQKQYKMAMFYMLPKLHKSEHVNYILNQNSSKYIHLADFTEEIEGRPIVGGPCYYTSGLSEMLDIILKPILEYIPHILNDSFDLIERLDKTVDENVLLGTCDIKALYTNISHDLAYKAIDYWLTLYQNVIPILQRFSKRFILRALQIILEFNFFLFNVMFHEQIKGFAMGTKAAVNAANLVVAYLEVKMFALLPTLYPPDFVDFVIRNYFRFLDDIFHEWLRNFDISQFYEIFDTLDPNLKFIFSTLSSQANFLDINFNIQNDELIMDIYYKPTNSFNFVNYSSSHPRHTRDNIALSLAKRICRIVSTHETQELRLFELKHHLAQREHPIEKINFAFTKIYQPKLAKKADVIVFTTTYNPSHVFDQGIIKRTLDNYQSDSMKKAFNRYEVILGSRQPPSLRKQLVKSRFPPSPGTRNDQLAKGLFHCPSCIYHEQGLITECTQFHFGRNAEFEWRYNRHFNCDSLNVIYIIICNYCWHFYIGETGDFKQRTCLHKSNTQHPENSNCRKLSRHLHHHSQLEMPYFQIFPVLYHDDAKRRRFLEKRLIHKYKPPLNGDT